MKTPVTVRIQADLLNAARDVAARENRTLTNFIETVLRERVAQAGYVPTSQASSDHGEKGAIFK